MTKQEEKPQVNKENKVQLLSLNKKIIKVRIVGDTPLLTHKFGETNKTKILNKQTQKSSVRVARDIDAEVEEATYYTENGKEGIPSAAFKNALVEACVYLPGLDKKLMRGSVHLKDTGILPITFKKKVVNEATVKINRGLSGDVRFRPQFNDWSVTLTIMFNESLVSVDQIINCLNYSGFHIGVGDWRPQKNGNYGMYHVESN